ncbi:SitA5 family polymorphic toxin [Myxococcus landrumensis]|uniref:SitA5 family polymorphic toxin n=1 Tax=Myxococcus landrumensis TaxID=2813577 RepID=UPI001F50C8FA|nr:hypothetical protein [Myxococcus landrumus]
MRVGWGGVALLLGSLVMGCATTRAVHLDLGEGEPLLYRPPRSERPIVIDEGEFQQAMTRLVLDMHFSIRPEAAARPRTQLASWEGGARTAGRDYGAWCSRQDQPGECLSLLEDGFAVLDARARRKLALSFAWDGVWEGVQDAVKDVVNPLALKAMLTSAMAAYMFLVVAPEPLTKVVAIALTTYVIAYIGLDSFTNMVGGWQRLSMAAEHALSLEELEEAGRHFGRVMGENGARVLILALTAVLGGGVANMAAKGPMLPGFARAALAAETQMGLRMSAAFTGGVRSIFLAEGILTVGVTAGAVAMTAWNNGEGGGAERSPHGEQRANEAREGDAHRQVGDANRVLHEGRKFTDAETGNVVYVSGDRVVITDALGRIITQFKNPRANTQARIQSGRWVPVHE